ncbi:MAG: hypothetical protein A2275_01225 [Bacteroidetes bacterium RIFOXYA12_FULL_35_11]|nr:MAG: hypothetical protein A2X01_09990 [Bacteroidetes bacterium GWF2_35_48]OFY75673.1 MAG: hypothetical protein A2275_01225 [Bacteroidetes bacterium RIFOXYA12_FULL_35_11]OFY96593.1 MAG: hypothetical protein A2309_04550 [Bacteroidetes bacterium RIFOXYB2_FULL_35_7]OFZ01279.1 MAG: hypothetical protein A2491_13955 [Bacteroidetes bacterium RIFOXYC12_FULL_35_7]HBX50936.1 hypothetical protein [Bacteroidales bacterium]
MPIISTKILADGLSIGFWKMTESVDALEQNIRFTTDEKIEFSAFSIDKRKKEFICTLLLAQHLLKERIFILHDEHGKPFLKGHAENISISHSSEFLAVMVSTQNIVPGIDVEYISDRVEKIKHKFLSASELEFISTENRSKHLLTCWCVKEAILKIYGKKDLDFKENIKICPFHSEDTRISAYLSKDNLNTRIQLDACIIDNYMVVWGWQKEK